MKDVPDLYAILGVSPSSEDVVIKAAYRALMRRYHPDTNSDPSAIAKARKINEAYEILGNPERRAAYDSARPNAHKKEDRATSSTGPTRKEDENKRSDKTTDKLERQAIFKGNGLAAFGAFASLALFTGLVFAGSNARTAEQPSFSYPDERDAQMAASESFERDGGSLSEQVNAQADAMATAANSIMPEFPETKVLSRTPDPVSFATVEAAAHRFFSVMESSGMIGARRESERCHKAQEESRTWDTLDSCAAFDFAAAALDTAVTSNTSWNRNAYFDFQSQNQADYYQPYPYLVRERLNQIKKAAESALLQKVSDTKAPNRGSEGTGTAAKSALVASIVRKVRPYWRPPEGTDISGVATTLTFQIARDGSVIGEPRVVSQEGFPAGNSYLGEAHAERAIRAVKAAAPFNLPPEQYETWRNVAGLRFDSKL